MPWTDEYKIEYKHVLPRDWTDACNVGGAVNAGGVIRSLAAVTQRIWADAHEAGKGTDWVNHHPIIACYVTSLVGLTSVCTHDIEAWGFCWKQTTPIVHEPVMEMVPL